MINLVEFKRRLAAGEFDDVVRSLLWEDVLDDEPDDPGSDLSPEMQTVLDRGRLLSRSTLLPLRIEDGGPSIHSTGEHKLRLPMSPDESVPSELTMELREDGSATLIGLHSTAGFALDLVSVVPHLKRNAFLRKLTPDSSSVAPRRDASETQHRIPTTTILSTGTGSLGKEGEKAQPIASFEVTWISASEGFCISTPVRNGDGEELLVQVTIENSQPAPVILQRLDGDNPQIVGQCALLDDLRDASRVKVKVNSIDLETLSEMTPEFVSLWLATQPMIAMPLTPTEGGHTLMLYESDRMFLKQHPNAILAIRIVGKEAGGQG